MDYHSMKQKMVSLLFILAFGYNAVFALENSCTEEMNCPEDRALQGKAKTFNPNTRLPINHADSTELIKMQLSCNDEEFAKEMRHFLMNIDDAIFQYLHYNGHEKKYATHIGRFNHHLTTLKFIIERSERLPERAHALIILKNMYKNLAELIKHVTKAQGSKGFLAAVNLGKNIEPLLRNFGACFPNIILTVDDQIKRAYNIQDVSAKVLLNHLQKRLELK